MSKRGEQIVKDALAEKFCECKAGRRESTSLSAQPEMISQPPSQSGMAVWRRVCSNCGRRRFGR